MSLFFRYLLLLLTVSVFVQCATHDRQMATTSPQEKPSMIPEEPNPQGYLHFMLGEISQLNASPQEAIKHFRIARQYDDRSHLLQMKEAEQWLSLNQTDKAAEILQATQEAESPSFYLLKARVETNRGNILRANRAMDAAIQLLKQRGDRSRIREVSLMKVALLSDARFYLRSVETLESHLEDFPRDEVAYYFLGKLQSMLYETEAAKASFKKAIDLRPSFTEAAEALALNYELDGKNDEAIEVYKKILPRAQNEQEILEKLSNILLAEERYNDALEYLNDLSKLKPKDLNLKIRAALIHLRFEEYEKARTLLSRATEGNPDTSNRAHFYLGALYEEKERHEKAIKHFNQINNDSSYYEEAQLQIAHLYSDKLNATDRSIQSLNKALDKTPYSQNLYLALASYQEMAEGPVRAIRVLEEAIKRIGETETILYSLGSYLEQIGEHEAGIKKMKKVLEINPQHAHALNHIGYVYTEQGKNLEQAKELLVKAVQLEPQNGYIVDSLGWLYYQKGNYTKARKLLEKANELTPDEPMILEHLADAYIELGMKEEALEVYEKIVRKSAGGDNKKPSKEMQTQQRIKEKIQSVAEDEREPL